MSIPASTVVEVTPRVIRAGASGLEFNGLVFTKNPLASICDVFTSSDQVGDQFGYDSDEYNFSQVYFAADQNKTKSPNLILFSRFLDEATSAWLRGYTVETSLADFQKVTDGALTLSINGAETKATAIDLSTAKSLSDVATAVAAKFTGITGEYHAGMNCFIFTTEDTGSEKSISFPIDVTAGTDLAELMVLKESQGAVVWTGTDAMAFAQNVDMVISKTSNWVTYTTMFEPTYEQALELSKWVSANFGFIYLANTTETSAEVSNSKADMATKLADAGVSYTAAVYGSYEYNAFFMGMIAATDFDATNGMKTYAFKGSAILSANVTDAKAAASLKEKRYNFIGNFATRNAEFDFSAWGTLIGSQYRFIDELVGQIWLTNEIQKVCVNGLTTVNRAPYNPDGYTIVRLWITEPINAGKKNGLINQGMPLSAVQKSALLQEVGMDVSQTIFNEGWYLKIDDATPEARSDRDSPDAAMFYAYAGAIHKLRIPVTAMY